MKKILLSLGLISVVALGQSFIKGNILYETPTLTTASNGTTPLLVTSQPNQVLTGTTTHTFSLPNVQTPSPDISAGFTYKFKNKSTGNLSIVYADLSAAFTLRADEQADIVLTSNATTNGTWAIKYLSYVRTAGDTMSGSLVLDYTSANRALITNTNKVVTASTVTDTELAYLSGLTTSLTPNLNGLTANVQTQINAKVNRAGDTMTGGLGIDYVGVTANTVPVLDAARRFTSTTIDPTELGYLDGATANIQTQINNMGGVTGNFVSKTGDTMSGPLMIGVTGTAAAPALKLADGNSGIYQSANGRIAFSLSGGFAADFRLNGTNGGRLLLATDATDSAVINTSSSTGSSIYCGGSSITSGGCIRVYGNTHATKPHNWELLSNNGISIEGTTSLITATDPLLALAGVTTNMSSLTGVTGVIRKQAPQGAGAVVSHTITEPGLQGGTTTVAVNDGGGTLSWLAAVVASDATVGVKIVGAEVAQTASTTCSVTRGLGVGVNCNTDGNVNITFNNSFSETPWCVTGLSENVNDTSCRGNTPSTSGFTTTCTNQAGTGQNRSRSFVCFGKR